MAEKRLFRKCRFSLFGQRFVTPGIIIGEHFLGTESDGSDGKRSPET